MGKMGKATVGDWDSVGMPTRASARMREHDRELAFLVHCYDSLLLFQEVGERTRGQAAATNQG